MARWTDEVAEKAIDEFLEGQPRAETWRSLRETLQVRLDSAVAEEKALGADDPARAALKKRIKELRVQVAALAQEEVVTGFVEETVRASLSRPRSFEFDEDEENG